MAPASIRDIRPAQLDETEREPQPLRVVADPALLVLRELVSRRLHLGGLSTGSHVAAPGDRFRSRGRQIRMRVDKGVMTRRTASRQTMASGRGRPRWPVGRSADAPPVQPNDRLARPPANDVDSSQKVHRGVARSIPFRLELTFVNTDDPAALTDLTRILRRIANRDDQG